MDDPVRMRERDRLAHAKKHAEPVGQLATRRHPAIEPVAAHALHGVEQPAVGQLAEIVNRHDAGMLEPRQDARFVRLVLRPLHDLEGDVAVEHRVVRQVDDAHAAAARAPRSGS